MQTASNLPKTSISTWTAAIFGSILSLDLTSVFPILLCGKFFAGNTKTHQIRLRYLLSFTLGNLLANTFIHILPECWNASRQCELPFCTQGYIIISGIVIFTGIEKLFENYECGFDPAGYLNLIANVFDNFVHGLSVGGAFLLGHKVGTITVLSIVAHEIPHEFSDFGLLLSSGFSVREAALAQLYTSTSSVAGAVSALLLFQAGYLSILVLLITSGAFIHLALVNIMTQLQQERGSRCSLKNLSAMLCGMGLICTLKKSGLV